MNSKQWSTASMLSISGFARDIYYANYYAGVGDGRWRKKNNVDLGGGGYGNKKGEGKKLQHKLRE